MEKTGGVDRNSRPLQGVGIIVFTYGPVLFAQNKNIALADFDFRFLVGISLSPHQAQSTGCSVTRSAVGKQAEL